MLGDVHPRVFREVLMALGRDPATYGETIKSMFGDDDARVRAAAVRALGQEDASVLRAR